MFAVYYRWLKKVIKIISEVLEDDTLTPEERADRELVRTRNQIEIHRKRAQNQIKAKLVFHGKPLALSKRQWLWTSQNVMWCNSQAERLGQDEKVAFLEPI